MKVLIACFSQTGNTEKIALAVQDELSKGHQVELARIDQIGPTSPAAMTWFSSARHVTPGTSRPKRNPF